LGIGNNGVQPLSVPMIESHVATTQAYNYLC